MEPSDIACTSPGKVLVVGLGISGLSACELLLRLGAQVVVTDMKPRENFGPEVKSLEERGCVLRLGEHRVEDFLTADLIIVSPGVPLDLGPLREAARRGVEVIGEFDWACSRVSVPVIAVTGTNGKTTTTSLIGEILKNAGRRVFVGGNIGTPLSARLMQDARDDILVLEVSSFQLDTAHRFRPEVGVLLNITEDHLDRYENFAAYADSKFSLFSRQDSSHVAVVNGDDPLCAERVGRLPSRTLVFGGRHGNADASVRDGRIAVTIPGETAFELDLGRTPLRGVHNEENIMAAALAVSAVGVPPSVIQETIDGYKGLSHRMEWVRSWNGIDFYDDSKATNVGAVLKALENFERSVLLLLGGRDKLGSYDPLIKPLKDKGKGVFVFGEAAPRINRELEGKVPVRSFAGLEDAFREAVAAARSGDVVLLSPACSSFDQYESYARRGDHFKSLVAQLSEEAR